MDGKITLSQARRIVPVINQENQEEWIGNASTLSQQELEKAVTAVNPKAHVQEKIRPVAREVSELKVALDPATEENLKVLQDLLAQKKGRHVSLAEVVAHITELAREKMDPVRKARRARSTVSSGNPPKKGRVKMPAAVNHEVALRDGGQCTHVSDNGRRCGARRWLHVHHVKEVSKGGSNTPDNLRTLCSAHHKMMHSHDNPATSPKP